MSAAVAVTVTCPACREPLAKRTYLYARVYLCDAHRREWDANDERTHRNSATCPHFPRACARCGTKAHKHDYSDGDVCNGCDMAKAAR